MLSESYKYRIQQLSGIILEDFKSKALEFIKQGVDKEIVVKYIDTFKIIKDKKYKQLFDDIHGVNIPKERRHDIDAYKSFHDLELVVDYVKGQVDVHNASLGSTLNIDAKPIFENDVFEIYYADSPRACITYKGNIPYSWCVSRTDASNMYYTYRLKDHQPAFYFVKIKDRTKKELGFFSMVGNVFKGEFKDKYHFFVMQVVKNADIANENQQQYLVTSAMNDGDKQMSWSDILKIENRLSGLQHLFKPIPLSKEEEEDYNRYKNGISDEEYCKLSYEKKRRYIDIYVKTDALLTDGQFACTPEDLKNLYVGLGVGLSENQLQSISNQPKLLKRYKQITEKLVEEFIKNKRKINFSITQLLILEEKDRETLINNLSENNVDKFLKYSTEKDKMAQIIINYKKENLSNSNVFDLLDYSIDKDKIAQTILQYKKSNLSDKDISSLLFFSTDKDQIAQIIINYKKENLSNSNVHTLLNYHSPNNYGIRQSLKKYRPDYFNVQETKKTISKKILNDTASIAQVLKSMELFHGNQKDGKLGKNTFLSNKEHVSFAYASRGLQKNPITTKYVLLTTNLYNSDAKTPEQIFVDIKYAKNNGYDGIVIYDYDDGFDVFDNYVIFDNKNIAIGDSNSVAKSYHSAKIDGGNPNLVNAVEKLLKNHLTEQLKKIIRTNILNNFN